jgi:hypothetical protein
MFRNGRNDIWYLEDQAVTPRVVRRIIEAGLDSGWRPAESGLPLFELDGQPFLDAELFLKRSARELRGIGWVIIVGRLERDYGVDLRRLDFDKQMGQRGEELTVSDLWHRVSKWFRELWELYQSQGFSVPQIEWMAFAGILSEELSIPRKRVQPESRLAADLGMGADIAEPDAPADRPRD